MASYPDLKGKVAVVTGIGQSGPLDSTAWGNGAAIARVLCQNGVKVFGCDLHLAAAEHTASRLHAENGICDVLAADVTLLPDVERLMAAAVAKHGRIDLLVNNVGQTATGDAASMPQDLWDAQLALNLKTVYLCCHVALPIMAAQGAGAVVNNASIAGLRYLGKPQVAYATAKAAVIHFTRVTAVEYAARGVRLNTVVPGMIYTPLIEMLGNSESEVDREIFRKITDHNVPMGRMGDPFDVANAAVFLLSDSAKYITGQQLIVDGGLTSSTGTGAG